MMRKVQGSLMAGLLFLGLLSGCVTSVPVEDYTLARAAYEAAKEAEALRYAPALWYNAEQAYRLGQRAYKERHYDEAEQQFKEAKVAAEKAENAARIARQNAGGIKMKKLVYISLVFLSGCTLDTRSQVKQEDERTVIRKQVQNLQQTTADVNTRFQDVEDDVRKANGRIEALETRLQRSAQDQQGKNDKASQAMDARLNELDKAYREEFKALHAEIDALKSQAEARRSSDAAAASAQAKDPFGTAESKFESKNYKEAILDYQAYRKSNPSGKHFATATYKIGASFQEMGMIDEARAFYDEVIAKFPRSKDASRAQAKLKALKKK